MTSQAQLEMERDVMTMRRFDVLSSGDLANIREIIRMRLSEVIESELPSIGEYHRHVTPEMHSRVAFKKHRILPRAAAEAVLDAPSLRDYLGQYSNFGLSDVVYGETVEKRPEVYFRVVRPSETGDVGQPHCDHWFHRVVNLPYREGSTWKIWIVLETEPGMNGLMSFPDIDPAQIPWKVAEGRDGPRPIFVNSDQDLGEPVLVYADPGQALLFRDDVLHSGSVNHGNLTRVSMEVTLVPKESS